VRPVGTAFGCLLVAGAALDAAALTLLGFVLAHEAGAPRGDLLLRGLHEAILRQADLFGPGFPGGSPVFALAGAAFVYLMVRIVLGLLAGAVSLFGARGRKRS
jgi:hypothetical protein